MTREKDMSREEAKQIISDIDKAYRNFTADEYKALAMAIQALRRVERWEKHICFDCKYFSENEEEYDEKRCLKCTLIGTEWEQKK